MLNKEMEHGVKSHGGMKDVEPKTTGSDLCGTADTRTARGCSRNSVGDEVHRKLS